MSEKLFGRVYESIGDSSSDLLLKTKGLVKILWGNKFIDLLKDGKVNYPKDEIKKIIEETINFTNKPEIVQEKEEIDILILETTNIKKLEDDSKKTEESVISLLDLLKNTDKAIAEIKAVIDTNKKYIDEDSLENILSEYVKNNDNLDIPVNGVLMYYGDSAPIGWTKVLEETFPEYEGYIYIKRV